MNEASKRSADKSIVKLENVHKSYMLGETTVNALSGLSFSLKRGEFIALIGASGAGKSTLLNLVGCLDQPDSGKILIDDVDVTQLSDDEKSDLRNHKIGFIFQSFNLIPVLNVFENVELPLMIRKEMSVAERSEKVRKALKDVGLESFHKSLPDKLSGGQRQRVAIARAIVTDPQLILADEPTANLDSKTAHMIIDLLHELNLKHSVTCLFCSHDEKLMGRVERTVRIKDGIIEE